MWTMFIILGLMPVLVFIELTVQKLLFKNVAEIHDLELELYQHSYD